MALMSAILTVHLKGEKKAVSMDEKRADTRATLTVTRRAELTVLMKAVEKVVLKVESMAAMWRVTSDTVKDQDSASR